MGFGGGDLAEEEAEAADGEANSHEAEAGANPGEKGSLSGEVDAGVLFSGLVSEIHGGIVRQAMASRSGFALPGFAEDPGGHAALVLDYGGFDWIDQVGV